MNVEKPLLARHLTRSYRVAPFRGKMVALERFSADLLPGMVCGLVGPNGSGKTTAVRCCLGLLAPTAGRVELFGLPPGSRAVRASLGYAPETYGLCSRRTGRETLELLGALSGLGGKKLANRIDGLLERFELSAAADRRLSGFSKGMVRRLSIAGSLLGDPRLLVLDEPFDGLDPLGGQIVREEIRARANRGAAILVSSHALPDLEAVATHLTILAAGATLEQGTLDGVLARRDRIEMVLQGVSENDLQRIREVVRELGGDLVSAGPARESLEDLFRRRVGGGDD
ncbi:MAG: ABC transporter ATP-binding protein [Planctomycetota bacterium]